MLVIFLDLFEKITSLDDATGIRFEVSCGVYFQEVNERGSSSVARVVNIRCKITKCLRVNFPDNQWKYNDSYRKRNRAHLHWEAYMMKSGIAALQRHLILFWVSFGGWKFRWVSHTLYEGSNQSGRLIHLNRTAHMGVWRLESFFTSERLTLLVIERDSSGS